MRFFNKFFSSIKSHYLNDNKYNNSLFSNLRIHFEREMKYKSNITLFGNTFRNSKWSDLHKINIKESFLQTFLYSILTILFCMSTLMCFWGKAKSEQYFGFLPFFYLWDALLNQTLIYLNESQAQIFILIFSLISFIFTQFQQLFANTVFQFLNLVINPKNNTNTGTTKKKVTYTSKHLKKQTCNLSTTKSPHYSKVLYNLLTIQNSLLYLKNLPVINHGVDITNPKVPFFWRLISQNTIEVTQDTITLSEVKYGVDINTNRIINNHLNLKSIHLYTNTHESLLQFDFNLINNINIGKEQRWLVKNSNLTEFLTKNNNSLTQSKKLIGQSYYSPNFINKNLWLPTKLSNMSNTETLSYINNLNNLTYPNLFGSSELNTSKPANLTRSQDLINLNFIENSRLWITKKYFFTNQMNSNLINQSKILSDKIYQQNTTPYTTNSFDNKLFFQNYVKDLSTLLWTKPVNQSGTNNYLTDQTAPNNLMLSTASLDLLSSNDLNFLLTLTSNNRPTSQVQFYSTIPSKNSL